MALRSHTVVHRVLHWRVRRAWLRRHPACISTRCLPAQIAATDFFRCCVKEETKPLLALHRIGDTAMKSLLMILLAVSLAGCVVYPARPAYYRPAVVVY